MNTKTYQELLNRQKEIQLLGSMQGLLEWDQRTYMPQAGAEHRAEQTALIAGVIHQKRTAPPIDKLLHELEADREPDDSPEAVNIREWRRDYDKQTKLSRELVEELTRTSVLSQQTWQQARADKDFSLFQPWLEKTLDLKRREAEAYGYTDDIYDPLLDTYEPGVKAVEVGKVLGELREALVPLMKSIAASGRKRDSSILHRDYPPAAQSAFVHKVAASIGYDFNAGRIDETVHPFCIGLGPGDVRITTRYIPDFLNSALFGIIHEAGHGLYEQNLPREHWGTPMGEAVSLGIHESQSRLWENLVGRSRAFWEFWYPTAQDHFQSLQNVPLDDFYLAINAVQPSLIRVEADEVTYNLHILLRFELERELLTGRLAVADLPPAWNAKFFDYFGLEVPDDSLGCLQDIHWSAGLFGYFPTYSLGNLNAAQLYAAAEGELGGLPAMFRRGEFQPLLGWLQRNVHQHGRRYNSAELIQRATGKPLSADAAVRYLEGKYGGRQVV